MSKRFRLSDAIKRLSNNCFNKLVRPLENFLVRFLPVKVIFPSFFGEYYSHSDSSRSVPLPLSSSKIDSRSLLAFFGLLNKYAVSSRAL